MSTTTNPPGRELGPGRFQRRDAQREPRSLLRSMTATVVLLALLVVVPAALLMLNGAPSIPTSLPSRDDLTAAIGAEQLVTVLVWVAWLAWLQFAVCVVVELRSAVSGIGLPGRVPLSGPSQRFARVLVGTLLLAATAAGPANAAGASAPAHAAAVAAAGDQHVEAQPSDAMAAAPPAAATAIPSGPIG
ncbi:MAG: hypothetical protein ACRDWI_17655, partial [Jiangellaceae bacterium]